MRKRIPTLFPPATIGIVGGGQLGRMIAFEAKRMGYRVIILDPKVNAPAGQVSDEQIVSEYSDVSALRELAKKCDVLTYEFEHIDADALETIENEGAIIYPSVGTLKQIKNKYLQKTMLKENHIPVPEIIKIDNQESLYDAFESLGGKMFVKSCYDGYDGKGNRLVSCVEDIEATYLAFEGQPLMAESFVDFVREVSIIVAKNEFGHKYYPVSENLHQSSILIKSVIPAAISNELNDRIIETANKVMDLLDDYGVFCIECFITADDQVLVNEIAPRPHNSGHYTIEGCSTSQFEQLVRVICGLPLGSTTLRSPCTMVNILGSHDVNGPYKLLGLDTFLTLPETHLHLYGKPESGPLKKLGHITVLASTAEVADANALSALNALKFIEI